MISLLLISKTSQEAAAGTDYSEEPISRIEEAITGLG